MKTNVELIHFEFIGAWNYLWTCASTSHLNTWAHTHLPYSSSVGWKVKSMPDFKPRWVLIQREHVTSLHHVVRLNVYSWLASLWVFKRSEMSCLCNVPKTHALVCSKSHTLLLRCQISKKTVKKAIYHTWTKHAAQHQCLIQICCNGERRVSWIADTNVSLHANAVTSLPLRHQYGVHWGCYVSIIAHSSFEPFWECRSENTFTYVSV